MSLAEELQTLFWMCLTFLFGFEGHDVFGIDQRTDNIEDCEVGRNELELLILVIYFVKGALQCGLFVHKAQAFTAEGVPALKEQRFSIVFSVFIHAYLAYQNLFQIFHECIVLV